MNTINDGLLNKINLNKIDNGTKLDKLSSDPSRLDRKKHEKYELDRLLHIVKTTPVQVASKQKVDQCKAEILSDHYNPNLHLIIARLSDELLAEGILDD